MDADYITFGTSMIYCFQRRLKTGFSAAYYLDRLIGADVVGYQFFDYRYIILACRYDDLICFTSYKTFHALKKYGFAAQLCGYLIKTHTASASCRKYYSACEHNAPLYISQSACSYRGI